MADQTLEERVAALEAKVDQLTEGQTQTPSSEELSTPWWKDIVGIFKDSPGFEEAVRYGREWREAVQHDYGKEGPNEDVP